MAKTIFITGSTSGFGEACARRFGAEGWRLILAGRRKQRLESLYNELQSKTPVHIAVFDVRNFKEVASACQKLPEDFKDVDVLVNNAGLAAGFDPAYEASLEDWETMVDTNIKGVMYLTRMILPGMIERDRGHIVNIGSVAGNWPYPSGNVYGATKAFVKQFSNNLRCDVLGANVRVSNIEPGIAETEFSLVRFKGDAAKARELYCNTKSLTAEDIAEIIFWTVSLPPHVNVNRLEVMPTWQAWSPFAIHRQE